MRGNERGAVGKTPSNMFSKVVERWAHSEAKNKLEQRSGCESNKG
jgi:hypothetical protein